ncbi:fumarylacetoacetate hydrolase family protein [Paenibacillus sp. IB182496]|uniref:Fumarylacetoacetate hydrolase family protein n=1 Tax=Paenibacillus sabuli TaxID=2772509 RepID=A0A927BRI6_9BACL|nr:fumarylacetoacetate hydrolase family protein [Paenibacillus sabuli]MBD2844148.1 fumarylacetoacetate hydrolase family protein [Paenibacillus sabuli]
MRFARFVSGFDSTIYTGIGEEGRWRVIEGSVLTGEWRRTEISFVEADVRFLAPLIPNEIIGIGANYAKDATQRATAPELPILFMKPTTTVIGTEDVIRLPPGEESIKFESELAVIIGHTARNIEERRAQDYIFGYTIANDVTAPSYFHPNGHWMIGKCWDTFCPLGPIIETELDPEATVVEAYVNGVRRQRGETRLMLTSVSRMVAYVSAFMTLKPGDVLLTGTPGGAGPVSDGDVVECRIAGIGRLRNRVAKASAAEEGLR